MGLNKLQQEEIRAWKILMQMDAEAILRYYRVIKAIDPESARRALAEIIQKFQEPLDKQHQLDELEQNWNVGYVEKAEYEKRKAELLA